MPYVIFALIETHTNPTWTFQHYIKYCIWCHLLFEFTQCYLLYISSFVNKGQNGCSNMIEYKHLYSLKI